MGGGGDAESEDKNEDEDEDNYEGKEYYNYKDNSTIDDLWYKLQCDAVFASSPRILHNNTTWIYLCLVYKRNIGANNSTLSSSTLSLGGDNGFDVPHQKVQVERKVQGIVADEIIREGLWI